MTTPKHNFIKVNQPELQINDESRQTSNRQRMSEKSESEISVLSDTMSRCMSISNVKLKDASIESKPASSLSDLAYHHLKRSVSGRAQRDQESLQNKLNIEKGKSKPTFCGFVIPYLSKPEEECNRSRSKKANSVKCPSMLTNLLGAKRVESEESVNSSEDWVIDLSSAIRNPELRNNQNSSEDKHPKQLIQVDNSDENEDCGKAKLPPCSFDASNILKMKFTYAEEECSSFGRIICNSPTQLPGPFIPRRKRYEGNIRRFCFDKPSPDDIVLANQERKTNY